MPKYCPSCTEEYRDQVAHCADCGVELVTNRDEAERLRAEVEFKSPTEVAEQTESDEEHIDEVSLLAVDLEVAELLRESFISGFVPAYVDDLSPDSAAGGGAAFKVAVPAELAPQAAQVLSGLARQLKILHNDSGEAMYAMQTEEEAKRIAEHPLLGREPSQLVAEGDRHIADLLHLLEDTDGRAVARAGERVLAYGERGVMSLLELIASRASDIPEVATVHAMATLSRVRGQPLPTAYRKIVERVEDPRSRRDLLRVVGVVGDESALDLLVDGLDDEHEDVRAEAIDSLWLVTGETLDYDAESGLPERAESVDRWRAWLRDQAGSA